MNISLTPEQERLIQDKLQAGKYRTAEEVLEIALLLLDKYDHADAEWTADMGEKIDVAIEASEHTSPVDGEAVVN
jgi:antitoxin ParD1/3/4